MDSASRNGQRVLWAFWIACAVVAIGGVAPYLIAGGSSRISGVVFPFALAALALGACALLHEQGRPLATMLYFLASLAIVYGILAMLAVPLRLAVIGQCPPEPATCGLGLERPMTGGETTALGFAVGMGIVAILTGFFGLVTLYRRAPAQPPPTPPVRSIAPVGTRPPAGAAPAPPPATPTTSQPEGALRAPGRPEVEAPPEISSPQAEPELELPAHEPELELPAHLPGSQLPDPPPVDTPQASSVAMPPAPQQPRPRRRRVPKAPPDSSTTPDSDA